MCINVLHVNDECKVNGASDIGTAALNQFLHHPFIRGDLQFGCWKVSSAVCVLDPLEAMTSQEKESFRAKQREAWHSRSPFESKVETDDDRKAKAAEKTQLDGLACLDANQFLRNGFFQDPALANQGNERFLVASYGNWAPKGAGGMPTLTHAQAQAIQFHVPPPKPPPPGGKDAEILQAIKSSHQPSAPQLADLLRNVSRLVTEGGSIDRSHALHAASANNNDAALMALLEMVESRVAVVNTADEHGIMPLMCAAVSAAGRNSINGTGETRVIDALLAAGANKSKQDPKGLTAYGHFVRQRKEHEVMMSALTGRAFSGSSPKHPTVTALEQKLMPPGGPSASDLNGGEGPQSGFMDHTEEDRIADEEMGRVPGGGCDDDDDCWFEHLPDSASATSLTVCVAIYSRQRL